MGLESGLLTLRPEPHLHSKPSVSGSLFPTKVTVFTDRLRQPARCTVSLGCVLKTLLDVSTPHMRALASLWSCFLPRASSGVTLEIGSLQNVPSADFLISPGTFKSSLWLLVPWPLLFLIFLRNACEAGITQPQKQRKCS